MEDTKQERLAKCFDLCAELACSDIESNLEVLHEIMSRMGSYIELGRYGHANEIFTNINIEEFIYDFETLIETSEAQDIGEDSTVEYFDEFFDDGAIDD